jgi:hypothetical protein
MSDPLARVDKEVTVQLLVIVDELQEGKVDGKNDLLSL